VGSVAKVVEFDVERMEERGLPGMFPWVLMMGRAAARVGIRRVRRVVAFIVEMGREVCDMWVQC